MSSISVSSLVLGSLTMEVEGADASLSLSVLATAPAVLSVELGTPGAQGDAATIAVGTTSTLAPGSSATVANVGTSSAAVFNFGIPAGQTGATGATGSQGPAGNAATIAAGTTTTGAPGSSASVTNVGSSSAAVFNFTIPRGDKGETGNTGATGATGSPGTAATIAAGTTTTGAPGSSASVTNSGTSGAAVFDFTIPRGDVGATGATGATGPAGPGVAAGGSYGAVPEQGQRGLLRHHVVNHRPGRPLPDDLDHVPDDRQRHEGSDSWHGSLVHCHPERHHLLTTRRTTCTARCWPTIPARAPCPWT